MNFKGLLEKFLKKNRRQKLVLVSVAFFAYVLLLTGIFSYLRGKDSVTNKLTAVNGSVTLLEPMWDNQGQFMARASEPGMIIPKNPYGYNNGDIDLFIRIKMTIELEEYDDTINNLTGTDTEDGEVRIPTDAKRLEKIVDAVMLGDGAGAEADYRFITLDTTGESVSEWKINSCSNDKFVFDAVNYSGNGTDKDKKLVFYFYYTNGDTDGKMCAVSPGGSTDELFQYIDIPIYKKDYLGIFDQKYDISLKAEGIPVDGNEGLTASGAPAAFEGA